MTEHICGTYKWHYNDGVDWVCICKTSEYYGDWTEYEDKCEEWEVRK